MAHSCAGGRARADPRPAANPARRTRQDLLQAGASIPGRAPEKPTPCRLFRRAVPITTPTPGRMIILSSANGRGCDTANVFRRLGIPPAVEVVALRDGDRT